MVISDDRKKEIEEEERLRTQVRQEIKQEKVDLPDSPINWITLAIPFLASLALWLLLAFYAQSKAGDVAMHDYLTGGIPHEDWISSELFHGALEGNWFVPVIGAAFSYLLFFLKTQRKDGNS